MRSRSAIVEEAEIFARTTVETLFSPLSTRTELVPPSLDRFGVASDERMKLAVLAERPIPRTVQSSTYH